MNRIQLLISELDKVELRDTEKRLYLLAGSMVALYKELDRFSLQMVSEDTPFQILLERSKEIIVECDGNQQYQTLEQRDTFSDLKEEFRTIETTATERQSFLQQKVMSTKCKSLQSTNEYISDSCEHQLETSAAITAKEEQQMERAATTDTAPTESKSGTFVTQPPQLFQSGTPVYPRAATASTTQDESNSSKRQKLAPQPETSLYPSTEATNTTPFGSSMNLPRPILKV